MTKLTHVALAGVFAASMIAAAAPAAFAEDSGTTANGGSASANGGSSGDKTDKSTQENANSADKDKQQK